MRCAIRGDNASQRPRTTRPEQHQVTHLDCQSVSRLCLMPWQDTDGFGSVRSVLMLQSGFWDAGQNAHPEAGRRVPALAGYAGPAGTCVPLARR